MCDTFNYCNYHTVASLQTHYSWVTRSGSSSLMPYSLGKGQIFGVVFQKTAEDSVHPSLGHISLYSMLSNVYRYSLRIQKPQQVTTQRTLGLIFSSSLYRPVLFLNHRHSQVCNEYKINVSSIIIHASLLCKQRINNNHTYIQTTKVQIPV